LIPNPKAPTAATIVHAANAVYGLRWLGALLCPPGGGGPGTIEGKLMVGPASATVNDGRSVSVLSVGSDERAVAVRGVGSDAVAVMSSKDDCASALLEA